MDVILQAIGLVVTPTTLAVIFASAAFGLFVGAIPGLTATMATALLVPFSFYMEPVPAIAAIISCTTMAIIAGDIPGALLRIPGTPASAAYVDEAYSMTKAGNPARALGISLSASTFGGLFGFIALLFVAPLLGKVALQFSSFEYFWLALLGLSCAALISAASRVKSLISLLMGLFIAMVGLDPLTATPRFSFGWTELMGGISFIPAMIGMFALSEVLRFNPRDKAAASTRITVGNPLAGIVKVLWNHKYIRTARAVRSAP